MTKNVSSDKIRQIEPDESKNLNPNGCIKPNLPIAEPRKHYRTKKSGKTVKGNIAEVFRLLGGIKGMLEWAQTHRTGFYKDIYSKMLPKEIDASIDSNDNAQRYTLLDEESQELRATATRIIQLRLAKTEETDPNRVTNEAEKKDKT